MISSHRDDKNWEDREVGKFGRLGRSRGLEVRVVDNFGRLGRSGRLKGCCHILQDMAIFTVCFFVFFMAFKFLFIELTCSANHNIY
jgi:hypothetical protein